MRTKSLPFLHIRFLTITLLIFSLSLSLFSACSLSQRASKKMDKAEYVRADSLLRKAWLKKGPSPASYWLRSRLLLDTAYLYQIDSAHHYIDSALALLPNADKKQLNELKKLKADSSNLFRQAARVDSAAFARAAAEHTVSSYQYFLDFYADAPQAEEAIRQRNALAFARASAEDTWQAYLRFAETYPQAEETAEARERYEELLFKERTQTGTLQAYRQFLAEHPETPYRQRLLRNILLLSTADNEPKSFRKFLADYPQSGRWAQQAANRLYYLDSTFVHKLPAAPWADSLRQASDLASQAWLTVLTVEGWQVLNEKGESMLGPFQDVHPDYRCQTIYSDVLEVRNQGPELRARNGSLLFSGDYSAVQELGEGLLRIRYRNHWGLWHKSGSLIVQPMYDALAMLSPRLFWVKQAELQGLLAPNGQWLLPLQKDSIRSLGNFILIGQDSSWQLSTADLLRKHAQQNTKALNGTSYQNLRLLAGDTLLLAQNTQGYHLLNEELKPLLPPRPFPLSLASAEVAIERDSSGYRLHALKELSLPDGRFSAYQLKYPWLALRDSARWALLNLESGQSSLPVYDSLLLLQPGLWYSRQQGETQLHFLQEDTVSMELAADARVRLLLPSRRHGADNVLYNVLVTQNRQMQVFAPKGQARFAGRYTEVQHPDSGIYVLKTSRGAQVCDAEGKPYDSRRYEAIGNYQDGRLITLNKGRFGMIAPYQQLILPPAYDAAPRSLNDTLFQASHKKRWGLINAEGDWLLPPTYEEIQLWNDSSAWVRTDQSWSLRSIKQDSVLLEGVIKLQRWDDATGGYYALISTDAGDGVLHSQRGQLIPPTYDDLYNLSSPAEPLFYVEKEVDEVDMHIVQYINAQGKPLFQRAYTHQEWLQTYCD